MSFVIGDAVDDVTVHEPLRRSALHGLDRELPLFPWQDRALAAWGEAGRKGVIAAVTGAGKTLVGIEALRRHLHESNRYAKGVVVVPTIELMHQWDDAIRLWLPDVRVGLLGGGSRGHVVDAEILISVVNSAARLIPDQMRSISSKREVLLVADECHRLGATTFSRVLGAPFAATLGLSATPERAGDYGMEHLVFPSLGDVVFKYTHADGLADGVIADFAIALIGVDFTSGERGDFERANERVSDVLDWLLDAHPDLKGLGDEREFHAAVQALATREDSPALAFKAAIGKRKDIVISAVRRLELVTWLFEHARPAGKVILFHERIAACEALAEHLVEMGVPAAAHHSGLATPVRRKVLGDFAAGRIRALAAPRTLDEGIDVPDAEVALIVAGSSVGRQAIQRIGRVLRPADTKTIARVGLVYVRGTAEDPRGLGSLDGLVAEMQALDRVWWYDGGRERPALAQFFIGDGLPEPQLRPGARRSSAVSVERQDEDPAPPTFAETRSRIADLRRLRGSTRTAHRARLERDVKARVSWELGRIRKLPPEQARSEVMKLSRRRDQILAQIASASER